MSCGFPWLTYMYVPRWDTVFMKDVISVEKSWKILQHSPYMSADFQSVTPLFCLCSAGKSQILREQEPLWKIKSAVLLMVMTHHSDILKPSAPAEPIRACLGSDSSIREANWGVVWRGTGQGQIKDDGNIIFMLLKACLAALRICWWIFVEWLHNIPS